MVRLESAAARLSPPAPGRRAAPVAARRLPAAGLAAVRGRRRRAVTGAVRCARRQGGGRPHRALRRAVLARHRPRQPAHPPRHHRRRLRAATRRLAHASTARPTRGPVRPETPLSTERARPAGSAPTAARRDTHTSASAASQSLRRPADTLTSARHRQTYEQTVIGNTGVL